MTELQVFNTLTGKKELFVPINGNKVLIYACGPTVYDLSHLGHARMAITWDVIQRYLRYCGYDVTFVRNITDIDDKIIKRSAQMALRPEQVARKYIFEFWRDMAALNVSLPDFEPRATEYLQPMIRFAEELIASGHAYASQGDVYFDVSSFEQYGKLSKQNTEQLLTGWRDQVRCQDELAELKRSPVDFALWKRAGVDEPGWESPWGRGRPGWHLECSTMIRHVLGETIDIHGGGEDLVFPHHENEIAQSEALHQKPLAKYWLHNSFVQVSSEKMSKSLGNFATIQDLLQQYAPDAIRLLILQTHYRNPIDFTPAGLEAAQTAYTRLVRAANVPVDEDSIGTISSHEVSAAFKREFIDAMNNDFNTAIAGSALFALSDKIFTVNDASERSACVTTLRELAGVLGLVLEDNRKVIDSGTATKVVDALLELRQAAREKKDYGTADVIRKKLLDVGIAVMDSTGGSDWERV